MTSSAECAENAEAGTQNTPLSGTIPGRAFSSPFRALVWREWRASRWLLLLTATGPTVACLLGERGFPGDPLGRAIFPAYFAAAIFALFGLGLGAGLFASETADGAAHFREERPIARSVVWNAKLLMPLCALLVGLALYCIVSAWLSPYETFLTVKLDIPMSVSAVVFLMFAAATFFSVLLDRPITAFGAGGALAIALVVAQGLLFEKALLRLEWLDDYRTAFFAVLFLVESVLILLLSRLIFVRWTRD
jgi:hypothetical protein